MLVTRVLNDKEHRVQLNEEQCSNNKNRVQKMITKCLLYLSL